MEGIEIDYRILLIGVLSTKDTHQGVKELITRDQINQVVETIVQNVHPDKVILFGSYANGYQTNISIGNYIRQSCFCMGPENKGIVSKILKKPESITI